MWVGTKKPPAPSEPRVEGRGADAPRPGPSPGDRRALPVGARERHPASLQPLAEGACRGAAGDLDRLALPLEDGGEGCRFLRSQGADLASVHPHDPVVEEPHPGVLGDGVAVHPPPRHQTIEVAERSVEAIEVEASGEGSDLIQLEAQTGVGTVGAEPDQTLVPAPSLDLQRGPRMASATL